MKNAIEALIKLWILHSQYARATEKKIPVTIIPDSFK